MTAPVASPPPSPVLPAPQGPPKLRAHLLALVLLALLPALAFGAAASWEALRRQDQAEESRLLDTAQALAAAVDAGIRARLAALAVLAAEAGGEPEAPSPRLADLARTTAAMFGGRVTLYRPDGSQVLDTHLPAGAPLPAPGGAAGPGDGAAAIRQAVATARPVVSDIATCRVSGQANALVHVPVLREGVVRAVFAITLLPDDLSAILRGQAARGRGAAAITDARGVFAAPSRDAEQVIGQKRPAGEPLPPGPAVLRGTGVPDGEPIRTARHPIASAPGWDVWVSEPEATFARARHATIAALAGGAALALALGLMGAALVSRRLPRPVQALVRRATAVARGDSGPGRVPAMASPGPPAGVAEFDRLRRAVAGAEDKLRRVRRIGRVGGFEMDLRTGRNRRSAAYMDRQGLGPHPAEERHADWAHRLHPGHRAHAERHFLAAVADGAPVTDHAQEHRVVTPEGEVRRIHARAEIERDAAGRALRMVGAHGDVTALKAAEAALRDSQARLRLALEAARLGAWEVDILSGRAERTPRALEIFGQGPEDVSAIYPSWRDSVHPDDRAELDAKVAAVRNGLAEGYRIEYRFLRRDGRWIWVESHASGAGHDPATGLPTRLIGTSQDVTARRETEERQAVLIHELDHRAKNTLAVVQAALRLTPRHDAAGYARAVEGRIGALARAHTLLARDQWVGASLRTVAVEALAPFLVGDGAGARASLDGPPVALSPATVQALSMTFHELATNAARHGALSVPDGHVAIAWREEDGRLVLTWRETGGPVLDGPPASRGFGSYLIEATVARQLSAPLRVEWLPTGLLWEARVPLERLRPGGRDLAARAAVPRPETLAALPPG